MQITFNTNTFVTFESNSEKQSADFYRFFRIPSIAADLVVVMYSMATFFDFVRSR